MSFSHGYFAGDFQCQETLNFFVIAKQGIKIKNLVENTRKYKIKKNIAEKRKLAYNIGKLYRKGKLNERQGCKAKELK